MQFSSTGDDESMKEKDEAVKALGEKYVSALRKEISDLLGVEEDAVEIYLAVDVLSPEGMAFLDDLEKLLSDGEFDESDPLLQQLLKSDDLPLQ